MERKVFWLELFFDLIFVIVVVLMMYLLFSVDNYLDKIVVYFGEYLLMVMLMFWVWVG